MKRFPALLAAACLLLLISACSSVVKRTNFLPCDDAECRRCDGKGEYRCVKCRGRGHFRCSWCSGQGFVKCSHCYARGWKSGAPKKEKGKGEGKETRLLKPVNCSHCAGKGGLTCTHCDGERVLSCSACDGKGVIPCGLSSYYWVCRACGERFDYPARPCPKCGAK